MSTRRPRLAGGLIAFAALAGASFLVWLSLWITDRELWQQRPLGAVGLYPARLMLLGLAGVVLAGTWVRSVVRAGSSLWTKRCWSIAFAAVLTLLLLESAFMFVPRSHGVGYTLGSRIWRHLYWKPMNSLGYRDPEHVRIPGKKLVFAVGDSFTAGDGLADVESRFTNRLESRHPGLHVLNLGKNGSDTTDEFRRLCAHPLQPDVVVLEYYLNDIEDAARRAGKQVPSFAPYQDISWSSSRFVVRSSFLANFVYWQFEHTDGSRYEQFLQDALGDAEVMRLHHLDLERFCGYATAHGIPLVVVMFPFLRVGGIEGDSERARAMFASVKQLFQKHAVQVIDVTDLVQDLTPSARTVNSQNAHASAVVHERVADALWKVLGGL